MNTNREFEKLTQDWLGDRVAAPSLDGLREVLDQTATTPQARARFLGRWFDRGGGARRGTADHDHPPDSIRRSRIMYSAMAITAVIAITALAVSVIDTDQAPPNQLTGTYVVATDGSGDFDSIQAAVDAAAEGDTVLVRPGRYAEALAIDKDITLAGDGAREDIVISIPDGGPAYHFAAAGAVQQFTAAYSLLLDDTQAEVRGLAFAGPESDEADHTGSIVIVGGSPTLSDLLLDGADYALLIGSGSTATFTDSLVIDGGGVEAADRAEPLIAGNELRDGASIYGTMGDGTVIRDNTLTGGGSIGIGGNLGDAPADALIEGNTITGATGYAIAATTTIDRIGAPVIRDNVINGSRHGIQVGAGADPAATADGGADDSGGQPLVSGNDISAEMIGISVNWTDAEVVGNTVRDAWNGIVLFGGGSPEITENEIEVGGMGIDIGANTSPSVDGNSVCGGVESIEVNADATPTMGDNTTCDTA